MQVGSARGLGKEKIDRGEKMDESGGGKKRRGSESRMVM